MLPNAGLARETMLTQLATRADLLAGVAPYSTLGGYGRATLDVLGRQITIDAQLSRAEEFVTTARAQVKKDDDEFHRIDVSLGDHSLMAKLYDQDGHIVSDLRTIISLTMLMRYARARPKFLDTQHQDGIIASR